MSAASSFGFSLFMRYWLSCATLVLFAYNPFGRSFYHWVANSAGDLFFKLVVGLILLFTIVFLMWVIVGSVRWHGLLAGLVLWGLLSHQVLTLWAVEAPLLRELVILVCLATLLTVGLCWPHIVSQLCGQEEKRYLTKDKKKLGAGL